jgi:hypothetical protein
MVKQAKAAHLPHLNIGDNAGSFGQSVRAQKLLGRAVTLSPISAGSQEIEY